MIYRKPGIVSDAFASLCSEIFLEHPFLRSPIDQDELIENSTNLTKHFDKDGFELCSLEKLYLKENGIKWSQTAFDHSAIAIPWIEDKDLKTHSSIRIDHSFILMRPAFDGVALDELQRYAQQDIRIGKLTYLKPKFGLDLSIEVLTHEYYSELLHIEYDYSDFAELMDGVYEIESKMRSIDWREAVEKVLEFDQIFENLLSDDQSDLKAKLLGFGRTFNTIKATRN